MAVPLIDQDDPSTLERFFFLPQKEIPWMEPLCCFGTARGGGSTCCLFRQICRCSKLISSGIFQVICSLPGKVCARFRWKIFHIPIFRPQNFNECVLFLNFNIWIIVDLIVLKFREIRKTIFWQNWASCTAFPPKSRSEFFFFHFQSKTVSFSWEKLFRKRWGVAGERDESVRTSRLLLELISSTKWWTSSFKKTDTSSCPERHKWEIYRVQHPPL